MRWRGRDPRSGRGWFAEIKDCVLGLLPGGVWSSHPHPLPSTTGPSLPTSRYNDFLHDPLSLCKACRPQPNGENAISARSDLNPANGSYPFQALQQRSHGGIDAKVCQGPGLWVGSITVMAGEGVGCRLGQRRWQGGVRVRIGLGVVQARMGAGAPGLGWLGAQPGLTLSHLLCPAPR